MSLSKYEVGLIGDSNVGKTALFCRFFGGPFFETYCSTIGVNVEKDKDPTVAVYDCSGNEIYDDFITLWLKNVDLLLVCVDVRSADYVAQVEKWNKFATGLSKDRKIKKMLIGTKSDVSKGSSFSAEMSDHAKSLCMEYVECSAKTKANVEVLLDKIKTAAADKYAAPKAIGLAQPLLSKEPDSDSRCYCCPCSML